MTIGPFLRLLSGDALGPASSVRLTPELWAALDDACRRHGVSLTAVMKAVATGGTARAEAAAAGKRRFRLVDAIPPDE